VPILPITIAAIMAEDAVERFHRRVADAAGEGRLHKLVLAAYRGPEPGLQRLAVRPLALRGAPHLSFVWHHAQRDVTKNLPLADGLARLRAETGAAAFAHAHLLTADGSAGCELRFSRKGKPALIEARGAAPAPRDGDGGHNRARQHPLHLGLPFLAALGVATPAGTLVPAMARKWRQINKFVEIVSHALAAAPTLAAQAPLRIADFGCGKGYLTFALHHHLQAALPGRVVQTTGVDLKADVVAAGNAIVERLGIVGLAFEAGDIAGRAPRPLDVMIALHACDTATDHAIHLGIRSGAALIVCAPCCHKELRPQMKALPAPLAPMLQHGVHLGQQAEMLTDALRALLLQAHGYDTQVFEFVATEHTQKNKMILATRRAQPLPAEPVHAQIRALKDFYAVREQCLQPLLALRAAA
jgi:SAM-dependent methyltransferase